MIEEKFLTVALIMSLLFIITVFTSCLTALKAKNPTDIILGVMIANTAVTGTFYLLFLMIVRNVKDYE